jgi:uncharacterized membrane protein YkvA (DUF1232 family)
MGRCAQAGGRSGRWRAGIAAALVAIITAVPLAAKITVAAAAGGGLVNRAVELGHATALSSGALDRRVGRWMTRTERLFSRTAQSAVMIAVTLLWVVPSALCFFLWSALAATVDLGLLRKFVHHASQAWRELALGVRVFSRLAFDRQVPLLARLGLFAVLLYWLVPLDVLPEESATVGYADDLALAAAAGRAFLWLCPPQVIERQASAAVSRSRS